MRTLLLVTTVSLLVAAVPVSANITHVAADNVLPEPCFCSARMGNACSPCVDLRLSQSFSPRVPGKLMTIEIPLSVFGNDPLTVLLYRADAELPDELLSVITVPASMGLSGSGTQPPGRPLVTVDFSEKNVMLDEGKDYAFVMTSPGTWDTTFSQSDSYPDGRAYQSVNGGEWTPIFVGDSDLSFRITVEEAVPVQSSSWGAVKALY